jgi:hypothetical protein
MTEAEMRCSMLVCTSISRHGVAMSSVYITRKKEFKNDEKEFIETNLQIVRSPVDSSLSDRLSWC